MQALNKVLAHAGHPEAPSFTEDQVSGIQGFQGHYNHSLSADDEAAAATLRTFFERPNADLQKLMDTYFPSAGFQGFEPEL